MDEDNTGAQKDVHSGGYGRVLGGKKKKLLHWFDNWKSTKSRETSNTPWKGKLGSSAKEEPQCIGGV